MKLRFGLATVLFAPDGASGGGGASGASGAPSGASGASGPAGPGASGASGSPGASGASGASGPAASGATGATGASGPPAATAPKGLEHYWDPTKAALKIDALSADVTELTALRELKAKADPILAAQAARAAKIPGKPEDYDLALPTTLEVPEKYKDQIAPLPVEGKVAKKLTAGAIERGWTKDDMAWAMGLVAESRLEQLQAEDTAIESYRTEERKLLGTKVSDRENAVSREMKTRYGDTGASMAKLMFRSGEFEVLEHLLSRSTLPFRGGGAANPSQVSQEEWDKMTYAEKGAMQSKLGKNGKAA